EPVLAITRIVTTQREISTCRTERISALHLLPALQQFCGRRFQGQTPPKYAMRLCSQVIPRDSRHDFPRWTTAKGFLMPKKRRLCWLQAASRTRCLPSQSQGRVLPKTWRREPTCIFPT